MTTNTAHLNEAERQRYLEKTLIIGRNPYLIPSTLFCPLKSAPTVFSRRIYLSCTQSIPIHRRFQEYKCLSICNCRMGERHQETKNMYVITGHVSNSNSDYQPCYFSGG